MYVEWMMELSYLSSTFRNFTLLGIFDEFQQLLDADVEAKQGIQVDDIQEYK